MAKEWLAAIDKQPFVLFSSVGVHPLRRAQQASTLIFTSQITFNLLHLVIPLTCWLVLHLLKVVFLVSADFPLNVNSVPLISEDTTGLEFLICIC